MPRHRRKYLFKLYVPLVSVVTATAMALLSGKPEWLTLAVAGLSLAHFVQKEQLQELVFFRELFREFNARYDRLNNDLQGLVNDEAHFASADRARVLDYFNLCSEEFFYYQQGIIPRDVWSAWCCGMLEYLADERIAALWDEEEGRGSYYGLTRKAVESGAGPARITAPSRLRLAPPATRLRRDRRSPASTPVTP